MSDSSDMERTAVRFVTASGEEVSSVTRAQMREIDRIAVEETGPGLLQMMEHAGRAMARIVLDAAADHGTLRAVVLAGAGGNGGGGIATARHLSPRIGRVDLCLVRPERLSSAAASQLHTYRRTDGGEVTLDALEGAGYDIIVDAVIGYGLTGPPRGPERQAIDWAMRAGPRVFALDMPSGLDSDTGNTPGAHVRADITLTLHLPKPGLGSPAAGSLYLADLGIPAAVNRSLGIASPFYGPDFVIGIEKA